MSVAGHEVVAGRRLAAIDQINPDKIMQVAAARSSVGRTFDNLASMSSGEISRKYPMLSPLAQDLGAAQTRMDVARVFAEHVTSANYTMAQEGL